MSDNNLPKTEIELESWMKANCYNFNSYSINGNAIFEGFGIDKFGGLFIWYFTERGESNNLKYFQSESELIEDAFCQIKADKWATTHCIGFTTSKAEKEELANILKNTAVEFFQDEIPYYGPERPVYRTFVLGFNINNTKQLKEKYYKEKQKKTPAIIRLARQFSEWFIWEYFQNYHTTSSPTLFIGIRLNTSFELCKRIN